jgi:hypothetical protein
MPLRQQKSMTDADLLVTAVQARARVNRFLLSQIGSQFCAGEPDFDAVKNCWRVPVLMVTPGMIVGQVGEVLVNLTTRDILSHTEPESMYMAAEKLRKQKNAAIKAAFLQAGKR